ncbi:LRR receptor-like serine/threonine-protein kinase EFR [Linum perenne]
MITGDPLGVLSSWNDSVHFCEWYGVSCSKRHYGRVIELNLSSRGISGPISPHVGNLSFLRFLRLFNNSFTGEIPPEIGRLRRLEQLRLYNNLLDGTIPFSIGKLKSLEKLSLYNNKLSGHIPFSMGNLTRLIELDISDNYLFGEIPASIQNCKQLLRLHIFGNHLTGVIPLEVLSLTSLSIALDLSYNQFTGVLPGEVGNLKNLGILDLSYNMLSGSIPTSLGSCISLESLYLQGNHLQGIIPSSFLRLYNNNFIGEIPPGTYNQLSGRVPHTLGQLKSLTKLYLNINNLSGEIPASIFNLSSLTNLSGNRFTGTLPAEVGNLKNLEYLNLSHNMLSNSIPSSIGKLKSLEKLHLYNNKLSGYIPSSIGNLTKLIELDISDNYLFGEIPASIENCKQLTFLQISSNSLSGVIPPQLLSLTSLSIFLDLSGNRFTGTLPAEVGNLKNLGILNLSHNMLSGSIPTSLGSCISLESLYLQGNRLQGIIPSSLSALRGIQKLDLSSNNLSGQIPRFLESLNITTLLNLSHNNFDGEVPTQGVFKNSSIVSVIGNRKLCGGITALQLPPCSFTRHTKKTLSLKWKIIGVGSFGSVYKGVLSEIGEASINIAVKVFNLQRRGAFKSFMAECEALKNIRHKNLVRIVTVCSSVDHEGNDFKALIYEFLANGSLEDWLHRPVERICESTTTRSLNFFQRLNVAIDIASAVDYLHNNCGTPIVHCDLKPSNVLLDEDMTAHVGDFGLARFLSAVANPSSSTIGIKGTVGYAPPEYGMGNEVSIQGDIYSYGILLLELFTGKRPTDETFKDGLSLHNIVKSALSKQRTFEVLDPILLNELLRRLTTHHNHTTSSSDEARKDLEKLMSSILEIGVACSSDIPQERASMSEVLSSLTAIKTSLIGRR